MLRDVSRCIHPQSYRATEADIGRADICCAILFRTKPVLKPILVPDAGEMPIPGFTIGNMTERVLVLAKSSDLSRRIIYVWIRLRYLWEFLARIPYNDARTLDECRFSDKIDSIERYVLALLHSDSLARGGSVAFLTAFLNAALIYSWEELRTYPKWSNLCVCLSERIRSGLQLVDLSQVAEHCPDVLLWTLLLGRSGCSPLGGPGKPWYAQNIAELTAGVDINIPAAVVGLKYFETAEELIRLRERLGGEAS